MNIKVDAPIVGEGTHVRQAFTPRRVRNTALTPDGLVRAAEQAESEGNPMLATDLLGASKLLRERQELSAWAKGGAA